MVDDGQGGFTTGAGTRDQCEIWAAVPELIGSEQTSACRIEEPWLWNWRGLDVINAHERDPEVVRAGVRAGIDAVATGRLDPLALYTHRYPLERLGEALDAARDRPEGFIKALVVNE